MSTAVVAKAETFSVVSPVGYTNSPHQDVPVNNAAPSTRSFEWQSADGAVPPTDNVVSLRTLVAWPYEIIVRPETYGPSGASVTLSLQDPTVNTTLALGYYVNYNFYRGTIEYSPDPDPSSLGIDKTVNSRPELQADGKYKYYLEPSFNLNTVSSASVSTDYGPAGNGYIRNKFVAKATSGANSAMLNATGFSVTPVSIEVAQ